MRKIDSFLAVISISGFSSVIIQCLFVREFLAIFFGNELILGIIFSIWLLFCGIGSYFGDKTQSWHPSLYGWCLLIFTVLGFFLIRCFPVFFEPGAVIPVGVILCIFVGAEGPVSFLSGYVFGKLSKITSKGNVIYRFENLGALSGAIIVYIFALFEIKNSIFLIIALLPMPLLFLHKNLNKNLTNNPVKIFLVSLLLLFLSFTILFFDQNTALIKYAGPVSRLLYTKEGEIALLAFEDDTTILLNNTLYKSSLELPVTEQAVHIPASQIDNLENALVIFDRGHAAELSKYTNIHIDIIETISSIASLQSIITPPVKFTSDIKYDIIYIGSSLPENAASNRFYTISFINKMQSLMTPKGVLSFTLPFNENYMQKNEYILFAVLQNTLQSLFQNVLIFPGSGHATFMASNSTLHIPEKCRVPTEYLSSYILPSITSKLIEEVNTYTDIHYVNKTTKPIALYFALQNWMDTYDFSTLLLTAFFICVFILSILIIPRSLSAVSVATSGFTTGIYSIGIMLLYQATFGSLYAEIGLLILALTLGFAVGSKTSYFPHSDLIIGIYTLGTFFLIGFLSQPPATVFFICHFGIGLLSSAQFVTRKNTSFGLLNTADLLGGVFGMFLSSIILFPLFGFVPVIFGLFCVKFFLALIMIKNKISFQL